MSDTAATTPELRGAEFYNRRALRFYELILRFNCRWLWRCPISRIVRHYDEHVSGRHLDIGVANGWALQACRFPVARPSVTLMDLNAEALEVASANLSELGPRTAQGNVLEPFPLPAGSFDSVAMSFLLHCVPGDMTTKAAAFDNAARVLAPGGILFGATVLSRGVEHTRLSRRAVAALNRRGDFNNADDALEDLDAALSARFAEREVTVEGAVALFSARVPAAAAQE